MSTSGQDNTRLMNYIISDNITDDIQESNRIRGEPVQSQSQIENMIDNSDIRTLRNFFRELSPAALKL